MNAPETPLQYLLRPACAYCDQDDPAKLRVIDCDGYIPDDYICAECFTGTDDGPCWDDLPELVK